MVTVFDVFKSVDYKLYKTTKRGTVSGIAVGSDVYNGSGVFKKRTGSNIPNEAENGSGQPTLHVKPNVEAKRGMVVEVGGIKYNIIDTTDGTNFDTGVVEHITLILQEVAL